MKSRQLTISRRRLAGALVLLAAVTGVLLLWGPLLVTSPEEALSRVQRQQVWDSPETLTQAVARYEAEQGMAGEWRVEESGGWTWDDWYEGGRDGWRWIITYHAGDDDAYEGLWFAVGALGQVWKGDHDAAFLDTLRGVERAATPPAEPNVKNGKIRVLEERADGSLEEVWLNGSERRNVPAEEERSLNAEPSAPPVTTPGR
jgi:hypothetical protein